jgi:eukaryotic-like serine/threonine-protein kinase
MKLSAQEWLSLSRLLDEVLALPEAERQAWLETLPSEVAGLGATLRDLLARHAAEETHGFLKTLPKFETATLRGTSAVEARLGEGVVGPYRLVREIGHGGMGSVWLAERTDGLLKRPVALKFPHAGVYRIQLAERFARERDILAALSHPHIARLYDAGIADDGQPFLALEYVEGEPLGAYCDARRLDLSRRLALFLQVLDAVQYAHAHLVVHRDLKPSNVLVTPEGEVRLLDFGIAKLVKEGAAAETALTQVAGRALTLDYASPEQISGAPITVASDVYSLGVILYELLTGERPYRLKRASRGALEEAILEAEVARPSAACNDQSKAELRGTSVAKLAKILRGDLDTIVLKALKKTPAERYASATTFADDLRRYLAHEPVSARPDSLGYRGARFVRRNRIAVGLSSLAIVAMVAGLIGTATQAERAIRQAALAEAQRNRADNQARAATEQRDFALRQLSRAEAINDLNAFLLSDAAPSGKPFTAGELLSRAEAVVERQHGESDANRAEMLVAIGRQLLFTEHDDEARRLLGRAYEMSQALPDRTTRARAACALAAAIGANGEFQRAESLLREGLGELPDEPQFASDRIACLMRGSEVARDADDTVQDVARARAAQELLSQTPYPSKSTELRVLMNLAEAHRSASQFPAAIATFEQAYPRLIELGRENTQSAVTIYNNWALALEITGQPLRAEELLRRAVRISSDEGSDKQVSPMLLTNLARVSLELEHVREGVRLADEAHARAQATGDEPAARDSLLLRARAYRKLGDLARAETLLNDAESRTRRTRSPECVCFATFALERAYLAQAHGEIDAANTWADRGVAIAEASTSHPDALQYFLLRRAELELVQHRFDGAKADAARSVQLGLASAPSSTPSSRLGLAYLALGRAFAGLGQRQEARGALSSAVEHLRPTLGSDHPQTKLAERLLANPKSGTIG